MSERTLHFAHFPLKPKVFFDRKVKIIRFEKEHCHGANKGTMGAIKIKQTIKESSL